MAEIVSELSQIVLKEFQYFTSKRVLGEKVVKSSADAFGVITLEKTPCDFMKSFSTKFEIEIFYLLHKRYHDERRIKEFMIIYSQQFSTNERNGEEMKKVFILSLRFHSKFFTFRCSLFAQCSF